MKDNKLDKPKPIRKIPGKKPSPNSPNFMWIYAVVIGVILVGMLFSNTGGGSAIDYKTFETKMLIPGDVDHLVAYKSGDLLIAEVDIKKDSHKMALYTDVNKANG